MIHHISIPARNPEHVAGALAELMGRRCVPFGPLESAFMATSGASHGTMIEVYPDRATLEVAPPAITLEYLASLQGAAPATMSDPEAVRLMRATHIKEPA